MSSCVAVPSIVTTFLALVISYPSAAAEPGKVSISQAAFDAFVADDFGKFEKYLPNETDVRAWAKAEGAQLPEAELNAAVKERVERCTTKAKTSFRKIRDTFAVSGFDWKKAELVEAYTLVPDGNGSKRIPFDPATKERKLDVMLEIKSGDKRIVLKLDDCFLIEGRRFLADGFYVRSWKNIQIVEPKEAT